jgi:hypothetical protein
MTLAALELNDQSLLIQAEDGALHAEPGFARLTEDGIVSGEEARSVAWREPQHVYNQYWCQLSQKPLPSRHRHARHHADIAFAQLRKLWRNTGSSEALVLLVPGSFATPQLSLLLGMIEALPSRACAVLDSALAACLDAAGDTLFVDLQMHEAVLTVCRPAGARVAIVGQEVFPGLGMAQIQNSLARHISDLMIESYRFDPLHSSATEQAIFDQIPHWLTRLRWETNVSTLLNSDHGEHACVLHREAIRKLARQRLAGVRSFMEKWPDCRVRLSQASSMLTGLAAEFADAEVVEQTAATQRCLAHQEEILAQIEGLYRVQALSRTTEFTATEAVNGDLLATHLLCGDLALPLNRPVSVRLAETGPLLRGDLDAGAALTVVLRNRMLETLQRAAEVELPPTCRPGESIRVGGHELKLIRVGD